MQFDIVELNDRKLRMGIMGAVVTDGDGDNLSRGHLNN